MRTDPRGSIVHDYAAVKAAIETSSSVSEVLRKLGLRAAGGNYRALKNACVKHSLTLPTPDSEVFRAAQRKSLLANRPPLRTDDEVFCENSSYSNRVALKNRLRKIWTDWTCSGCGLGEIWNNKPITIQLDHINGVYNDNRIANLRLLCPNCHSQTETFAGRKQK
jgi:hypothetical protein